MKPKPFSLLNHFTVPETMLLLPIAYEGYPDRGQAQ
jgi:hypothetical protein